MGSFPAQGVRALRLAPTRPSGIVPTMPREPRHWPVCAGCGERVGVYERVLHVAPHVGVEQTSWLRLAARTITVDDVWHIECAESLGIPGG